jgi:hypothetical protein
MSLKPDHTAADLRALMDQFATAAESATPAAQANRIRQQLQESRPDVMRHRGDRTIRVVKQGGKPIGEIGIDAEASEGNGAYYVKLYDGSYDAVGYDTAEEALAELKAAIKQGVTEGSAGWMLRQDPALAKKVRDNTQGYKDLKKMAGKPVPKKDEKGVAEHSMYGDEEVSWEKGGRRAPTGAFRNPAVVKTDKSIGTRVSDIGPGGKEYNVKTDKEWDKQKGVAEAKRKMPAPKFTAYPSYHDWRLELMRRGDDQIDHLDNDYVDNYRVLFAVDRNRRVVGMYYHTADTGTFVPPGQGFSDMIYYADTDPHWPYGDDDDGKEDLRELSKDTLGSYVKKASKDVNDKSRETQWYKDMWAGNYPVRGAKKRVQQKRADIDKRVGGIGKAVDRLTKEGVAEGRAGVDDTDTVGFSVNSEAAYNAVMRRFGNAIDHDETSGVMYAPARVWPQIEMTAFDADPDSGAVRVEDDVMEQGVAEAKNLARRVRVVKTGETGTIRQIKHGAHKGAPKTYYVDLDNGGQADNLPASALRLIKGEVAEVKSKTHSEHSEMDTPAVQRAIAGMKQRHEKEPFDLEKARALGQKLAARNRDTRRK